jgi:hypothetical protein
MNKLILAIYILNLVELVTSWCDYYEQCGIQQNQNKNQNQNQGSGSCPIFYFVSGGLSGSCSPL